MKRTDYFLVKVYLKKELGPLTSEELTARNNNLTEPGLIGKRIRDFALLYDLPASLEYSNELLKGISLFSSIKM